MNLFSERYGYITPSDAFIVKSMPQTVVNALCNCIYELKINLGYHSNIYNEVNRNCWLYFLNRKQANFRYTHDCITGFIDSNSNVWHRKLSLIDFMIEVMETKCPVKVLTGFINNINAEFERLHYGYRIVNKMVAPITSEEEIRCIDESVNVSKDNIREHLNSALKHLADEEAPNYRNSIKESISAVGVLCREMTGENDLGKALSYLEKKQGNLHPQLKSAFNKLYDYVNEKQSGIRHELMDEKGTYVPTYHEAKFMLVTCSAFINYMNGKFCL